LVAYGFSHTVDKSLIHPTLLGALGEMDAAFEVVARAKEECQVFLYYTGLPGFDPLRAEPGFAGLLERLGLSPPAEP
jgi:hypothetical protein